VKGKILNLELRESSILKISLEVLFISYNLNGFIKNLEIKYLGYLESSSVNSPLQLDVNGCGCISG